MGAYVASLATEILAEREPNPSPVRYPGPPSLKDQPRLRSVEQRSRHWKKVSQHDQPQETPPDGEKMAMDGLSGETKDRLDQTCGENIHRAIRLPLFFARQRKLRSVLPRPRPVCTSLGIHQHPSRPWASRDLQRRVRIARRWPHSHTLRRRAHDVHNFVAIQRGSSGVGEGCVRPITSPWSCTSSLTSEGFAHHQWLVHGVWMFYRVIYTRLYEISMRALLSPTVQRDATKNN